MTKNAQQALRYLLQSYSSGVRFCLICNYISRIDEGLQNEFLRLRFNQLPETDIINFLSNIAKEEKLNMNNDKIKMIQQLYKSDMRSMINFMQTNQNHADDAVFNIINDDVLEELYCKFVNGDKIENLIQFIQKLSMNYNIDKKNIIKHYLNYIIRNKKERVTSDFLSFVENIMHFQDCKNSHFINYSVASLLSFTSSKYVKKM
jgi:DNA polymerase III delta prime subunit